MGISVLYVRISSLDGKIDRQRVNEEEYDRVIEDKCSGSIPIFEREGGRQLKKWIDEHFSLKKVCYLLRWLIENLI